MADPRNVAVLVGSLRKDSINRKVFHALIELAPPSLKPEIVEIGQLRFTIKTAIPAAGLLDRFSRTFSACNAVLFRDTGIQSLGPGCVKERYSRRLAAARSK